MEQKVKIQVLEELDFNKGIERAEKRPLCVPFHNCYYPMCAARSVGYGQVFVVMKGRATMNFTAPPQHTNN